MEQLSQYFEYEVHSSTLDAISSSTYGYEEFSSDSTTESVFPTVELSLNITKPSLKAQLLLYDILIPSLGTIIILLNLAVVVSSGLILKKGSQPRSTYLFLGNVAMCDLVTGIAVVFGQVYPKQARNQFICALQLGMIVSSTVASIYSVGLIAIDRYLYIIHGLQYQRWVYPTRARILILTTWIIGGIVGFLPIMGWSGDTQNGRVCWFIKLVPPKLVMMTCVIAMIPILVVIVLYSIILYHALKKIIQLRRAANQSNAPANCETGENKLRIFVGRSNTSEASDTEDIQTGDTQRKENMFKKLFFKKKNAPIDLKAPSKCKAIKVVLFVTGSFVVTWVPYFVAGALFVNCDPKVTPEKCKSLQVLIASPLAILGFCNSLLNPIIYAWWHKGFRTFVKKMICRKNVTSPPTSSGTKSTATSKKNSVSSMSNQSGNTVQMVNVELNTRM